MLKYIYYDLGEWSKMNLLVILVIMFGPILLVFGIINFISYKNWTSVYTALDDETYFRVVDKLKQAGIRYKTKSQTNLTTAPFGGNRQRNYEIYVKKEDAGNASCKLHS
jgi:flagellar biosynthesis/type III secretory pathway M-ring protein FliF/YscJ